MIVRSAPIPDEIIDKLAEIIKTAQAEGEHPINYFLKFPEPGEIEESMATEVHEGIANVSNSDEKITEKPGTSEGGSLRARLNALKKPEEKKPLIDLDELDEELSSLGTVDQLLEWLAVKMEETGEDLTSVLDESMTRDEMAEQIFLYFQAKMEEF